jgi:serine protease AprX
MKKVASLLLAAAIACFAGSSKNKVSSDLASMGTTSTVQVQVIVQWNISTGAATAQKIAALGGTVVSEFPSMHAGVYLIPASASSALGMDSSVKFISVDRQVSKKTVTIGLASATINAPYAWNLGYNGRGIGVAVIDSGINPDEDLGVYNNAPIYSQDFTGLVPASIKGPKGQQDGESDNSQKTSSAPDWYGHGQHVAGIIVSNGKSSLCKNCTQAFVGAAPGANLINLKVLDANGAGSDSSVMAAINQAIALKNTYNIRVINMSLGRPVFESYTQDPICQAVEAAWKAGIVVVVSAGNDGRDNSFGNEGYGTINSPGNDPYVLTVGAMKDMGTIVRSDDLVASYSSKGPTTVDHIVKPDIVAPGNKIVSLLNQNGTIALGQPEGIAPLAAYQSPAPQTGIIPVQPTYDPTSNTQPPAVKIGSGYSKQYYVMSGTSMAAGVVSGAVADLLQAAPGLTPDQVKMLLMQSASKTFPTVSTVTDSTTGQIYTDYYDVFTVGAGYLDLQAAMNMANQVPTGVTAISPTASYDSTSGNVSLVFDPSSVWSDRAMWGATSTTDANRAMWGATNSISANRAMWGATSTIWSNRAMWGASSSTYANRAMWGATSTIWSNRAMWGATSTVASQSITVNGEQ